MSCKSSNGKEFGVFKNEGIWRYYLRETNGQFAKCKLCDSILKVTGGSTKGLHVHMKTKHDVNVSKRPKDIATLVQCHCHCHGNR
jgi:hypothetical protein